MCSPLFAVGYIVMLPMSGNTQNQAASMPKKLQTSNSARATPIH